MDREEDFDHWLKIQPTPEAPVLEVTETSGIVPLDDQFGVDVPAIVPASLHGPMFGPQEPVISELNAAPNQPAETPPLATYAILDAAKITNLPELLDASGLAHRCLFKGEAFETLKDVSPWIVKLEDDNKFTQSLFTKSDAPWHLWGTDAGIFLRSNQALDALWSHFRKFTKVCDEDGKWFYWRFWEGQFLLPALRATEDVELKRFFFDGSIARFLILRTAPNPALVTLQITNQPKT